MTTPQDGIPPVPGQAEPSTPEPQVQPTPTPPASQEPASAPQIPAEVKAQLDALQRERDEYEKQARYHQSRADQEANRVRALAGLQQQSDPITPYLKQYTDMGIAETDAKVLAQRDYQTDQRINALQNSFQANNQIPQVLQQVYATAPHLFQNPKVQAVMEAGLRDAAANGQAQYVNSDYAFTLGATEYVRSMSQQQNPPPQPQAIPQFGSQFGPISGFSQTPNVTSQKPGLPPHIKAAADAEREAVAKRYGFQKPQ